MIVVAVRDLVFRSKIHAAADRLGVEVHLAPRGASLADAVSGVPAPTVLADLSEPGVLEQIPAAKQVPGLRVVGFAGHVQEELLEAARRAGVDEVLTRGQFVARLDELLRRG